MKQQNEKQPLIVGIGEILWDIFPSGKRAGGAPVNFVYHASALGARGYAISAIGKDALGAELIKELNKNNIYYLMPEVNYPTGTVLIELKDGNPSYTIVENTAWDHIPLDKRALDLVKEADAISFGTLALRSKESAQTIKALLAAASPKTLKFFDINLRQHYYSKELIEQLLQISDVFKINDEELKTVSEMFGIKGDEKEICLLFLEKYNLKYVVLTAGDKYSAVYARREESFLKTPRVEVADTVGAGDAFSGAFVYGVLTGKTLREAHETAVEVSAFVCTQTGAWPDYALLKQNCQKEKV